MQGAEHSLMDEHRLLAFICDRLLCWKVFGRQYLSDKGCIRVAILVSLGRDQTWHIELKTYTFKIWRQCLVGGDRRPEKPLLFACLVRLLTIISAQRVGFWGNQWNSRQLPLRAARMRVVLRLLLVGGKQLWRFLHLGPREPQPTYTAAINSQLQHYVE